MRTDTAGKLYVTRNGGKKVTVIDPSGVLSRDVALPTITNPTNLAFGASDGKTVYVVGRCAGSAWSQGNGCWESFNAVNAGREWEWLNAGGMPGSGTGGGTARCGVDWGDANGRCGTSCPSKTNAECTVAGETCFASLKTCGSATGSTTGADKAKADKDKAAADKAATDKAAADKASVDKAAADKAYADAKAKADASGSAEDAKAAADAKATASAAAAAAQAATDIAAASAKAASVAGGGGGGGGGDGVPSWVLAVVLVLCVAVLVTVVVGAWFYVKRHNKARRGGNEFSKSFGGVKSLEMGNA
jgi:hypothetical protein